MSKPTWDAENRQVTQAGHLLMPDGVPVPELNMPGSQPRLRPAALDLCYLDRNLVERVRNSRQRLNLAGFNVIVPIIFTEQDFDMYILGWSLSLFPDFLRDFFSEEQAVEDGNNAGGYINQEFEELSQGNSDLRDLRDL